MTPYQKLLQDPRWQKKRLEIFQRDNFTCRKCKSNTKTLHCHHQYYEKGVLPWEYEDFVYLTLCSDCHSEEEELKINDHTLLHVILNFGFTRSDFEKLTFSVEDFFMQNHQQHGMNATQSFDLLVQYLIKNQISK